MRFMDERFTLPKYFSTRFMAIIENVSTETLQFEFEKNNKKLSMGSHFKQWVSK